MVFDEIHFSVNGTKHTKGMFTMARPALVRYST